jgi:hypothetical protein
MEPHPLFGPDRRLLDLFHVLLFLLLLPLLLCHVYGGYLVDVLLTESGNQTLAVLSVDLVGLPRLQSYVPLTAFKVLEDLLVVNIFHSVFLMLNRLLVGFCVLESLRLEAVYALLSLNLLLFTLGVRILLKEFLDGFEVEVQGLVGEVVLFERECFCFHLDLQGHLRVV